MDISAIYDRAFFEAHVPWQAEYVLIADALAARLAFSSVLDLGCGNGFLIARLSALGKASDGIDGSPHAVALAAPEVAPRIQVMDLRASLRLGRRDLVICSEVAEHLDARYADILVDNICANCRQWAFFTAATPGQGGHHHVNEQPHEYWIAKFERRSFRLDLETTRALRREFSERLNTLWWFTRNAMLFEAS
jgi:SAM-dependent methyltransferase